MPQDRIEDFPEFHLAVTAVAGHTVIALRGELDVEHTDDLTRALREQAAQGPVHLDLGELTFMDSTGVRLLDTLLREADASGWTVTLAPELHPAVRRVLEVTGMLPLLPFQAVASAASTDERPGA
jgi:anti-anti-sigma factor